MNEMNDKWEFYKDAQDQWRCRRTAPNGISIGAETEDYVNIADCEGNVHRNCWEIDTRKKWFKNILGGYYERNE